MNDQVFMSPWKRPEVVDYYEEYFKQAGGNTFEMRFEVAVNEHAERIGVVDGTCAEKLEALKNHYELGEDK